MVVADLVRQIILSIVILTYAAQVSGELLYAIPSGDTACPDSLSSCHTLDEYAAYPNLYLVSNGSIDLILLPGEHNLMLTLYIRNIAVPFTITPFDTSSRNPTILCSDSEVAKLRFENVPHVRVSGIKFVGCVGNNFVSISQLVVEDCEWDGQRRDGIGLELLLVANASIWETNFTSHDGSDVNYLFGTSDSSEIGGGAMIANSSTVFISGCLFDGNTARLGGAFYCTNSVVTIETCTFVNNVAHDYGGGIYTTHTVLSIERSIFTNNSVNGYGGGIELISSAITRIYNCTFVSNKAASSSGGAINVYKSGVPRDVSNTVMSTVTIGNCTFVNNMAGSCGGGVYSSYTVLIIENSTFTNNSAYDSGGGMELVSNTFTRIYKSAFVSNRADSGGGIDVYIDSPMVSDVNMSANTFTISNCTFICNTADSYGGGIFSRYAVLRIENSVFTNNSVRSGFYGGGIFFGFAVLSIENSKFVNNSARSGSGGGIQIFSSTFILSNVDFIRNMADIGSALHIESSNVVSESLLFQNNMALTSVIKALLCNITIGGNSTILSNTGSLLAFVSNVTFSGETRFIHNSQVTSSELIHGGAVSSFQSSLVFNGKAVFMYNYASYGGAISAKESEVYMYGDISVSFNSALHGGGIFLFLSDLTFYGNIEISNNKAVMEGGGIHSVSARTIVTDGFVVLSNNSAKRGGGMYLELNAKLYITKSFAECMSGYFCKKKDSQTWIRLDLAENTAEYGGALYVADDTNSGICDSIPLQAQSTTSECFFQFLALHTVEESDLNVRNLFFTNNSAEYAGASLYGGLLDRCTVSLFSELFHVEKYKTDNPSSVKAVSAFLESTNMKEDDLTQLVSSDSTRVCFCDAYNQPNCNLKPPAFRKSRGETLKVSLVAVDQVNNTIAHSSVLGSLTDQVGLRLGQSIQKTSHDCKQLTYNIFSPHESEVLYLHTNGPCDDIGISSSSIDIEFLPCPAGFKTIGSNCDCDPILHPQFVSTCDIDRGMVLREGNVWISVLNGTAVSEDTRGYLTYTACPFDYCRLSDETVYIDMNEGNGADAQCAFNRSGILCGGCEEGFSLLLSSSRCQNCPNNNSLALLIPFALAGVLLVGFLLLCNLTVAVGSIDALIFYANIVGANQGILLPFESTNILSVFISWLNLDFGFEACFFNGFDEYDKQWLQIAFPFYIIFLVAMVIIFSKYNRFFAKLLSKRNPVATLATLLLLSFTKLVRTVIAALSFGQLNVHVNGTVETKIVWLIDGNVPYFEGKHIPLVIVAIMILFVALAYSLLLFFWQWLLRCSNAKFLRWIRDVRLNSFMDAYHAQLSRKHRYWTGLLLFVRVFLYLITALNVFGDPKIPLLSIVIVVGSLSLLVRGRIYKSIPLNVLEGIFLYNLIVFAVSTLYIQAIGNQHNIQITLAYVSTTIAFVMFLLILGYHIYAYLLLSCKPFRKLKESQTMKKIKKISFINMFDKARHAHRTEPLLESSKELEQQSADFSKYRGPLELIESGAFPESNSQAAYKPPTQRKCLNPMVTYSVVDAIPSENDVEQSMSEM